MLVDKFKANASIRGYDDILAGTLLALGDGD